MPGIDVNTQITCVWRKGYTPLHLAAERGHIECVKTLLSHPNINVNIKDNQGNTPLQVAQSSSYNDTTKKLVIEFLRQHGSTE